MATRLPARRGRIAAACCSRSITIAIVPDHEERYDAAAFVADFAARGTTQALG